MIILPVIIAGEFSVGTAPVLLHSKLGDNSEYVFALPTRNIPLQTFEIN